MGLGCTWLNPWLLGGLQPKPGQSAPLHVHLTLPPLLGGCGRGRVTKVALKKVDSWAAGEETSSSPGTVDLVGVRREPRMAPWPPHGECPLSVQQNSDLEKTEFPSFLLMIVLEIL